MNGNSAKLKTSKETKTHTTHFKFLNKNHLQYQEKSSFKS